MAEMSSIQVSLWMLALLFTTFLVSAQPEDLQENCQGDHQQNCQTNYEENYQETSQEDYQETVTIDDIESDCLAKYSGMFLTQQEIDAFNENRNRNKRTITDALLDRTTKMVRTRFHEICCSSEAVCHFDGHTCSKSWSTIHFHEKIYSACCDIVSELTKFDVVEDVNGMEVRIYQPKGKDYFQVFEADTTCKTVEDCRCGCRCAKVKRLYFAIVTDLDSNRPYPNYVYIRTVCRCINNLPERTEL